jgi:hypothetical protein
MGLGNFKKETQRRKIVLANHYLHGFQKLSLFLAHSRKRNPVFIFMLPTSNQSHIRDQWYRESGKKIKHNHYHLVHRKL